MIWVTLQGTNISHQTGKGTYLEYCLFRGYVSSQEGWVVHSLYQTK